MYTGRAIIRQLLLRMLPSLPGYFSGKLEYQLLGVPTTRVMGLDADNFRLGLCGIIMVGFSSPAREGFVCVEISFHTCPLSVRGRNRKRPLARFPVRARPPDSGLHGLVGHSVVHSQGRLQ